MHHDVNTIPTKIWNGVTIIAVRVAWRVNMILSIAIAPHWHFTIKHAIIRIIYNKCNEIYPTYTQHIYEKFECELSLCSYVIFHATNVLYSVRSDNITRQCPYVNEHPLKNFALIPIIFIPIIFSFRHFILAISLSIFLTIYFICF